MAAHVTKIFGPPGTGKTHALLSFIKEKNLKLNEVCAITFSRAAKEQLIEKAYEMFPTAKEEDFKYWKTQHGLNYELLALQKNQIANMRLGEFAKKHGYKLPTSVIRKKKYEEDAYEPFISFDEQYPHAILWQEYENQRKTGNVENSLRFLNSKGLLASFSSFVKNYKTWCSEENCTDFTDMIVQGIEKNLRPPSPVRAILVDEFQDNFELQVTQIKQWIPYYEYIVLAGDDDQAIHTYAGADPQLLLNFPCNEERVLSTTYRFGNGILDFAQHIIVKNKHRKEKHVIARNGNKGAVIVLPSLVGFLQTLPAFVSNEENRKKTFFILCRTNSFASKVRTLCGRYGLPVGIEADVKAAFDLMTQEPPATFNREILSLLSSSIFPDRYFEKRGTKARIKQILKGSSPCNTPWEDGMKDYGLSVMFYSDQRDKKASALNIDADDLTALMHARALFPHGLPLVEVTTIHASKGKEADIVLLIQDIPKKVYDAERGREFEREAEARVWYVAATRAREVLVVFNRNQFQSAYNYATVHIRAKEKIYE